MEESAWNEWHDGESKSIEEDSSGSVQGSADAYPHACK